MSTEKELLLHRCAVFGTRSQNDGYYPTLGYARAAIMQAIEEGYVTFITEARDGFELDLAKFLCVVKENNPSIHLVIVQPYAYKNRFWNTIPIYKQVCAQADAIRIISTADDPQAQEKTTEWMLDRCSRIISVTSSHGTIIERLKKFDCSEKEFVNIAARWSKEEGKYFRADNPIFFEDKENRREEEKKLRFPYNLLCDVLNLTPEKIKEQVFPDDVEARIISLLTQQGNRCLQIMKLRYEEELTLQAIGEKYDLSRERIRQIIKKSINKLRYKPRLSFLLGNNADSIEAPNDVSTNNEQ